MTITTFRSTTLDHSSRTRIEIASLAPGSRRGPGLSQYFTPKEVAEGSGVPVAAVEGIWRGLHRPEDLGRRAQEGSLPFEEERAFVAIFWSSIEGDVYGLLDRQRTGEE